MPRGCLGTFLKKEGGIQVLADLVPCGQPVGSLLRTPWLAKPVKRMGEEFTLMENTLNYFWLNTFHEFNKVGFCLSTYDKNGPILYFDTILKFILFLQEATLNVVNKWKRIRSKQNARWLHLSRLKVCDTALSIKVNKARHSAQWQYHYAGCHLMLIDVILSVVKPY